MKHIVKKSILLTMVLILLLGIFAGCGDAMYGDGETTPSVNAGANPDDLGSVDNNDNDSKDNETEDDPTRVFTIGDLDPLSKEKQLEVEEAWEEFHKVPLGWCNRVSERLFITSRYYGTFNNSVVFFVPGVATAVTTIEVAGHKIHYSSAFAIWVYNDGQFYRIDEAYEKGLLDETHIEKISKYHSKFEGYVREVAYS